MIHVVHLTALLAATSTKKSSSSIVPLLVIVALAFGGYFLFLRPQQQKNRAARQQGQTIDVGDEVQTIGGIIGTVVEMDNDRVTIVTGGDSGGTPTQLVLLRAAIAKKVEPRVPPSTGGMRYGNAEEFDEDHHNDHDEHDDEASAAHDEDDGAAEDAGGDKPR